MYVMARLNVFSYNENTVSCEVVVLYLSRLFTSKCDQTDVYTNDNNNMEKPLDSIEEKLFWDEKSKPHRKLISLGIFSKVYRLNYEGSDVRSTVIILPIDDY